MKRFFVAFLVIFIALLAGFFVFKDRLFPPKEVHIHAGFKVYTDNKQVLFTDLKYMHEQPCTINGKPVEGEHESGQEEKAHLHDFIGDVVHVHKEGATWGDLFTNLTYPIDEAKTTEYLNGKKTEHLLSTSIHAYDSALFFTGSNPSEAELVKSAVTVQHMKDIEKKSENCGGTS